MSETETLRLETETSQNRSRDLHHWHVLKYITHRILSTVLKYALRIFELTGPGDVKSRSGIFQRAVTWKPLQIRSNVLLMMDRKSYMVFHFATFALT